MNLLDAMLESLRDDPDTIPVIKTKWIDLDQDSIDDLRFLNLKLHAGESGICISHAWSWGVEGTEITIMLHIVDGHEEEYQRLLHEELWEEEIR